MDTLTVIRRLSHGPGVVEALTRDVAEAQAAWRPEPDRWSVVEVVAHLADEESRDFRTRLRHLLERRDGPWPPIDPEAWVVSERYAERALDDEVRRFREERARSVAWLEGLVDPDWSSSYEHSSLGTLRAADLLASWLAHDLIHIRQLNRLHRQYLESMTMPGARLGYAGRWSLTE